MAAFVSACGGSEGPREFVGIAQVNSYVSTFHECGSSTDVDFDYSFAGPGGAEFEKLRIGGDQSYQSCIYDLSCPPIYVTVQGTMRGPGKFGHAGEHKYQLQVEEFKRFEVQPYQPCE